MKYYFYSYWWEYQAQRTYIYSTVCAGVHPFQDVANNYPPGGKQSTEIISFQEISKVEYEMYEKLNEHK